ncbi:MAG: tetratricopeptide repeat protein, partial [Deltaproteobacteria bacterium]|nr:tetratricopeptide repeat protein [Deltaproteobacteria bacterium]
MMGIRSQPALAAPLLLTALLCSGHAHAEQPIEEAKEHFAKAVKLFKNQDYDAALVEFKQAYKAKPHFAVRYNIGITLYKLHRYKEAFKELESYMFQGGDEILDERRDEVVEILKDLESLLGTLKVTCNVEGATLFLDGWESEEWEIKLEV